MQSQQRGSEPKEIGISRSFLNRMCGRDHTHGAARFMCTDLQIAQASLFGSTLLLVAISQNFYLISRLLFALFGSVSVCSLFRFEHKHAVPLGAKHHNTQRMCSMNGSTVFVLSFLFLQLFLLLFLLLSRGRLTGNLYHLNGVSFAGQPHREDFQILSSNIEQSHLIRTS